MTSNSIAWSLVGVLFVVLMWMVDHNKPTVYKQWESGYQEEIVWAEYPDGRIVILTSEDLQSGWYSSPIPATWPKGQEIIRFSDGRTMVIPRMYVEGIRRDAQQRTAPAAVTLFSP